jgi:hypothetical protein
MDEKLIQVKMCVGGEGFDGPDLWFCMVAATQDEIDCGDHYVAAKKFIVDFYGIEATFACDENDMCKAVMGLFDWDSIKDEDTTPVSYWKTV